MLLSLWGTVSAAALRRWLTQHAVERQDDQLRALLAGKVPLPRAAADDIAVSQPRPVSARGR